jgi:hypothetical protein
MLLAIGVAQWPLPPACLIQFAIPFEPRRFLSNMLRATGVAQRPQARSPCVLRGMSLFLSRPDLLLSLPLAATMYQSNVSS